MADSGLDLGWWPNEYHRVAQDPFILKKGGGRRRAGGWLACQRHLGNIESLHRGQELFLVCDDTPNVNCIDPDDFIPSVELYSELKFIIDWSGNSIVRQCRVAHWITRIHVTVFVT